MKCSKCNIKDKQRGLSTSIMVHNIKPILCIDCYEKKRI